MTSLNPLHRVGRQIAEAITLHRPMPAAKLRKRVVEVLDQAGFADAEHRLDAFPHQLSGGQRQRVMIAMALVNDPVLLIADEPTTALDVTIQAQILKLLARLRTERQLAMLLITHDLQIVRRYADRMCVMKDGVIVEAGTRRRGVRGAITSVYTHAACRGAEGRAGVAAQSLEAAAAGRRREGAFPDPAGCAASNGRLRARGGRRIDLGATKARRSGWLANPVPARPRMALASLRLTEATGRVVFDGTDIETLDRRAMRRLRSCMQIVFQDPYGSLSPRMPVGDIVAEGLRVHEPSLSRAERARGSPRNSRRSGCLAMPRNAIRTNSAAASVSASPLRAPWC